MISFSSIPGNIRSPLAYVEVDANNANAGLQNNQRILVLGQMLSTGTATANVPVLVSNLNQAQGLFGAGSILAQMFSSLFKNNNFIETWALPVDDDGAAVKASGTITMTGSATASGTIALYCGGVLVPVAVASGDAVGTQATAMAAAINANKSLPVTATAALGVVTVTFANGGTVGNFYDMRINYNGESLPAGTSVAIVQLASGATDPSFTTAIANLPDQIFNYWCQPYISSGILDALDTELNSRWSGTRMLEGHAFGAASGSVSTLTTLGTGRNNPHQTILDAANLSPSPPYLWAAAVCGQVAMSASADPARPFTTLQLAGILPPAPQYRRSLADKNTLLYDGIATHMIDQAGNVMCERIITTYQTNAFDIADESWLDVTTPLTLSYFRQSVRTYVTNNYARMKLAADGTIFGAGTAMVTPNIVKSGLIGLASQWEAAGLMQDLEGFKNNLVVQINANDPTRLDVVLPPQIVSPLYIFAASISFIL